MNKKIFYTILGAVAALLLVAFLLWWFLRQPAPAPTNTGGFGSAEQASSTEAGRLQGSVGSPLLGVGAAQNTVSLGSGSTWRGSTVSGKLFLGSGNSAISGKIRLGLGSLITGSSKNGLIAGTVTLGSGSTLSGGKLTLGAGSTITGGSVTSASGTTTVIKSDAIVLGTITLGPGSVVTSDGLLLPAASSTLADLGVEVVGDIVLAPDTILPVAEVPTVAENQPAASPTEPETLPAPPAAETPAAGVPPVAVGTPLETVTPSAAAPAAPAAPDVVWLNPEPLALTSDTGGTAKGKTLPADTVFNPSAINSVDSSNPTGGVIPTIKISDNGQVSSASNGLGLAATVGITAAAGALSCGAADALNVLGLSGGTTLGASAGVTAGEADTAGKAAAATTFGGPVAAISVNTINLGETAAISYGYPASFAAIVGAIGGVSGQQKANDHIHTFWDCIARTLAKVALNQITSSVVNWINSGFSGTPSFVQNPTAFFQNVADNAAGQYIKSSALSFLCSPFRLQIKIAIANSYANRNAQSCTLTKVTSNIKGFMNGNFSNGGWGSLLQFTAVPTNNPYGAYAYASIGLQGSIAQALGVKNQDLTLGGGFLSFQKKSNCKTVSEDKLAPNANQKFTELPGPTQDGVVQYQVCDMITTTPGHVIADALGATEKSTFDSLNLAKSFDEIISALISQLVTKTLQSGLSTLSGTDGYASTYESADQQAAADAASILLLDMEADTKNAQDYGAVQQGSIRDLQDAQKKLNTLYNCWNGVALTATTTASTTAATNAASASSTLASLQTQVDAYNDNITKANTAITELESLMSRALDADSTATTDAIKADYDADKSAGKLFSKTDVTTAQDDRKTLQSSLATTNADTADSQKKCNAY